MPVTRREGQLCRTIFRYQLDKKAYFEVDPILSAQNHFSLAVIFVHDFELEARTVSNGFIFIDTWL